MTAPVVVTVLMCGAIAVACGSREERPEAHEPTQAASGGASEQRFEEAMRVFCDAPLHAEIPDDADPAEQMYALAAHIDARLENAEVRALFEALANVDGPDRAEYVQQAAARAGLEACPVVDRQPPAP